MDITAPQGMLAFQQEFPALDMREGRGKLEHTEMGDLKGGVLEQGQLGKGAMPKPMTLQMAQHQAEQKLIMDMSTQQAAKMLNTSMEAKESIMNS
jgi:hypothetical protein